jgi:hypothetical protein
MRTRAEIPTSVILSAITESGWRVEAIEESDSWRVRIIWHLKSVWSPQECDAYLLFLVDPMDDSPSPKICAVTASASRSPESGESKNQDILYFGKGWPRELNTFARQLNFFRTTSEALQMAP